MIGVAHLKRLTQGKRHAKKRKVHKKALKAKKLTLRAAAAQKTAADALPHKNAAVPSKLAPPSSEEVMTPLRSLGLYNATGSVTFRRAMRCL